MTFRHSFVTIAALSSNTIDAVLRIAAPVVSDCFGEIVKKRLPSPSGGLTLGGKKPFSGSVGGFAVEGSKDTRSIDSVRALRETVSSTTRSSVGLRSTTEDAVDVPG